MLTTRSIDVSPTQAIFKAPGASRFIWLRKSFGKVSIFSNKDGEQLEITLVDGEWVPLGSPVQELFITGELSETIEVMFSDVPRIVGQKQTAQGLNFADTNVSDVRTLGKPVLGGMVFEPGDATYTIKSLKANDANSEALEVLPPVDFNVGYLVQADANPPGPSSILDVRNAGTVVISIYQTTDAACIIKDSWGNSVPIYPEAGGAVLTTGIPANTVSGRYIVPATGMVSFSFEAPGATGQWQFYASQSSRVYTPRKE